MFKTFETEFCGRPLVVETGKMAQLAGGSCLVRYGETVWQLIMKKSFTLLVKSPAAS